SSPLRSSSSVAATSAPASDRRERRLPPQTRYRCLAMERSISRALSRPFPAAVVIAAALLFGACAASSPARTSTPLAAQPTPSTTSPCGEQTDPPASYDHVIWIWMENRKYREVIGNAAAPYTTALAN